MYVTTNLSLEGALKRAPSISRLRTLSGAPVSPDAPTFKEPRISTDYVAAGTQTLSAEMNSTPATSVLSFIR
jgi:hypothetical protein